MTDPSPIPSITIRYFDDCPNWQVAQERLELALKTLGLASQPNLQRVETAEEADRLGFRGSPTILIDGRDPFADGYGPTGLTCRVYRTEAGFEGSPSVNDLVDALRSR